MSPMIDSIDSRDVPRLTYRPCEHCGHRHYFLTDEGDADNCTACGCELSPVATIIANKTPITELLQYVRHDPSCRQPCNCGLDLLLKMAPDWLRGLLSLELRRALP